MTARVGILSTADNPLLPHLLDRVAEVDVEPVLVLDGRGFGARNRAIFAERTEGAFAARPLDPSVEVIHVDDHNDPHLPSRLRGAGVTFLANGGTPRIVGTALLEAYDVVNAHPGLLPDYRGATCCEWAIYEDAPVGVSAHFMDAGLDTGPIILSEQLPVEPGWSYTTVRVELYRLSHRVMARALHVVARDGLHPAALDAQPEGSAARRPMPPELLEEVKAKVAEGRYRPRAL